MSQMNQFYKRIKPFLYFSKHHDIWEWYKKWKLVLTAEEIDLSQDLNDWNNNL
jgi:hypothetical protein